MVCDTNDSDCKIGFDEYVNTGKIGLGVGISVAILLVVGASLLGFFHKKICKKPCRKYKDMTIVQNYSNFQNETTSKCSQGHPLMLFAPM